jgi:DNA-binding LacI/PurR family transcriptional regulator
MRRPKTVKLKDLAMDLGVSISTVSRALSGSGRVSQKTKERVTKAVRDANYTPNDVARSLRKQNAMSIGIIVTDITNSFFASVIKGAQNFSRGRGYSILLSNSDENELFEAEAMQLMLEKQVSGLILASVGNNAGKIRQFGSLGIPIVFIDNIPAAEGHYDTVTTDNRKAARLLAQKLIGKGYRDIGMITGPLNQSSGRQRYEGFLAAMEENGLTVRPEWVREGDFKMGSGFRCMTDILSLPACPRAVLISNNYMTYGAIRAIKAEGKAIPRDIAVAAFDTDDITGLISPSIATMNQAAEDIGGKAAEVIISRMNSAGAKPGVNLILDPLFQDGDSW